jgi:hypothetical protein
MSLNDFENFDFDFDEDFGFPTVDAPNVEDHDDYTLNGVKSKMGVATAGVLQAREKMEYAVAVAIDASTNFGYELGRTDERERVLEIIQTYGDVLGPTKDTLIALIEDERF